LAALWLLGVTESEQLVRRSQGRPLLATAGLQLRCCYRWGFDKAGGEESGNRESASGGEAGQAKFLIIVLKLRFF
jgi:hypothetical protein